MSAVRLVKKISDGLNSIVRTLVFLSTAAFTILLFAAVVARYLLQHPLIFSVEIGKLLFVWSAFLAVTVGYKEKLHIRFEFLNGFFRPLGVRITEVLIRLSGTVFFFVVLIRSIDFTKIVWPTFFPVLNLSQGWLYVSVVVSMSILIVHSIHLSIEAFWDLVASGSSGGGAE
jgi:TRAP-type C4-dicarboxylate transport system permease small subunit